MAFLEAVQQIGNIPGLLDLFIPFILFFALLFPLLKQVAFLDNDKVRTAIAFAMSLGIVLPHVLGTYPPCWDPINMMNAAFPKISFFIIAVLGIIIIAAIFGTKEMLGKGLGIFTLIGIIYVIFAVLSSLGGFQATGCAVLNYDVFGYPWLKLALGIAFFVGLYWWITSE